MKMGFPVDLLVTSNQLNELNELLDAVLGLRGVIDHIGKPRIAEQVFESWATQIERASRHQNIYCKISSMVTEADHQAWKPQQFKRYIEQVLEVFGPERVIFGTDWPVCLLQPMTKFWKLSKAPYRRRGENKKEQDYLEKIQGSFTSYDEGTFKLELIDGGTETPV